jgi:hypothetical protein
MYGPQYCCTLLGMKSVCATDMRVVVAIPLRSQSKCSYTALCSCREHNRVT